MGAEMVTVCPGPRSLFFTSFLGGLPLLHPPLAFYKQRGLFRMLRRLLLLQWEKTASGRMLGAQPELVGTWGSLVACLGRAQGLVSHFLVVLLTLVGNYYK